MINKNLKILRELKNMQQSDVAKKLNISTHTYHNKETGKTEFTISEAKKISELFSLSIEDIFFKSIDNIMNTEK